MKLYKKLELLFLGLINHIWFWFIMLHECKNIIKKRSLYKDVKLSRDQKKQIDDYYIKNYGKKVLYYWHRLYQSYTGRFDFKYIPEYIFSTRLELISNKRIDALPYANKNMLPVLFGGVLDNVRTPQTYIMCVKGTYFDANRNIISKAQAIDILKHFSNGCYQAVIKRTVDTSSGRDVRILDMQKGTDLIENEPIESIIKKMGKDFVVQERICPHSAFENLYQKSINTLRIVTYIINDKICVAPIIMRIGQGGGLVDNAHAGGMFIGVSYDGKLLKEAFTEYQKRYLVHPDTKVVFENYQLPCVPEICQAAIKLHQQIPMLKFVSWDFTVDSCEKIVLIEANLHSQTVWFQQMAHGKAFFGEDTGEILRLARNKI